jgi:predicted 2-oxoglutarate/Fe(II)-dependent dioxygenase YbiX
MITPGDRVPFYYGMTNERRFYSSEEQAGRTAILILGGALDRAILDPLLDAASQAAASFRDQQADVLLLVTGHAARGGTRGVPDGIRLVDCNAAFFAQCGATAEAPAILVTDRNLRVTARLVWDGGDPVTLVADLAHAAAAIGREPAGKCSLPAPVLMIPNLLDRPLCRHLIERFETMATFDSGVTGIDGDGQTRHRLDPQKKRRRDCLLPPDDGLHAHVLDLIFRRGAPEIRKAFQHSISHADRLLIARYDDTGGYFRRHRDNSGRDVAFRQFALSVNLNTEEYEGGNLLFPECNDHRYSPPAGGGIVFSASLLHEVTPVTRGCRYVLLTFLHDTAAEARRLLQQAEAEQTLPAPTE